MTKNSLGNFERIKPPKYRFGRHVLNEYEVCVIMAEVAEGRRKPGIQFKDEQGDIITIGEDGRCDITPARWGIKAKLTRRLIAAEKNK